jgi:hypothetical protein
MQNGALAIDRDRFLVMVVAMAGAACKGGGDAQAINVPSVVAPVDPVAPDAGNTQPVVVDTPPVGSGPVTQASGCEKENDTGTVDCSKMPKRKLGGPTCEGAQGVCDLLNDGYAYRPHAAQVAAECFAKLGSRICDINARKRCLEEGIRASCAEPKWDAKCEAKMDECRKARARITYTKEECMKVMSSLKGGDQTWALDAMGPSSEGTNTCRLMFTVF